MFVQRVLLYGLSLPLLLTGNAPAQKGHPPAPPVAAPAKPTLAAQMSVEGYDHLLNVLFPADHGTHPGLDYTLVLRFEPHFHPESQIVLRRFHNNKVEATYDRVVSGNAWRAAYAQGDQLSNSQYETIAKTIPTRHSSFTATDFDVQQWHAELLPLLSQGFTHLRKASKQIQRSGTWDVMTNGTRYELWLIQGDDEVHLISWDSEVEPLPSGTTGLVRWMNLIRWQAAGHTLATPPPARATAGQSPEPPPGGATENSQKGSPDR